MFNPCGKMNYFGRQSLVFPHIYKTDSIVHVHCHLLTNTLQETSIIFIDQKWYYIKGGIENHCFYYPLIGVSGILFYPCPYVRSFCIWFPLNKFHLNNSFEIIATAQGLQTESQVRFQFLPLFRSGLFVSYRHIITFVFNYGNS